MTSGRGPIVVGVDGSPDAVAALEWAADMAQQLDTEVIAVHALGLLSHLGAAPEPAQAHRQEIEAQLAGSWTQALRAARVTHRSEVDDGNPVMALLAAAAAHGAAMVVVGSRGTGGFAGLQLGSTSQQLAQHAPLPVVIVRHGSGPKGSGQR
ncbi:MAG TPA: universal stress protein [Acidimicrobiales bacterium]|nr:universal stress protein [Acidimicrobiales bacterium]